MSLNEIIKRFTLVSGLEMNEVSRYLPIISDCRELFAEKAGDGLSESVKRRLEHACAVYAYYRICTMLRDGGLRSFKAGDLQWSCEDISTACKNAEHMWSLEQAALGDIAGFDSGFAFRSVRV